MKFKTLQELSEKSDNNVGYNEDLKNEFIRLGKSFTKELVSELKSRGAVEVESSYNKAGIAVSGDFSVRGLYADGKTGFHVNLSLSVFSSDFGFYRATKSMKDYSGGVNRSITANLLDPQALAAAVMSDRMMEELRE